MSNGKRMSKRTRNLILASAAVVALGGVLAALLLLPAAGGDTASSETVSSDPAISLLDKSKGADGKAVEKPVKGVSVKLTDEEFAFVDKDGELAVETYKTLPVNSSAVDSLTSAITSISADKKVGAMDNPADFGFEKPVATVSATYHDDSTYSFEIGKETPLKDGYYFRQAGSPDIYIVGTDLGETVLTASTGYIGLTLMTAPTVKTDDTNGKAVLRDMSLSGTVREKMPFAFQMVTTADADTSFSYYTYKLTSPYLRGVNTNKSEALSAYTSLYASGVAKAFPTKEDLAKYGLDKPYSVATLHLAVTTTVDDPDASDVSTASGSEKKQKTSYYNVAPHTIKVGGKDEDGNYYVMADDIQVVYLVTPSSLSAWVDVQYDDLADSLLFMEDITNVQSLSLSINGQETLFQLSHYPDKEDSDDKLVVKAGDKTYKTADFRTLYQVIMGISRNSAAPAKPTGTPEIVFKLTRSGEKNPSVTASFYATTPSLYTCVLNTGEYYQVKASDISWLKTQFDNYLNGKDVKTQ